MTRNRTVGAALAVLLALPGLALAQGAAPAPRTGADSAFEAPPDEAAPPGGAPSAPATAASQAQAMQAGADQAVGLFMATCVRFPGDSAGLRGWVTGQGAPAMPRQASDAFLAGRAGQVFDVSYQSTRLALISLDDGGCEAVAEFADPGLVMSYVADALRQAAVPVTLKGDFADKQHPGVSQRVWQATLAGRQWVLNAVTAAQPPQASLGLHAFVAAQAPRAPR